MIATFSTSFKYAWSPLWLKTRIPKKYQLSAMILRNYSTRDFMARDHSATRTWVDDICLRKRLTYLQSNVVEMARLVPISAHCQRSLPVWLPPGEVLERPFFSPLAIYSRKATKFCTSAKTKHKKRIFGRIFLSFQGKITKFPKKVEFFFATFLLGF